MSRYNNLRSEFRGERSATDTATTTAATAGGTGRRDRHNIRGETGSRKRCSPPTGLGLGSSTSRFLRMHQRRCDSWIWLWRWSRLGQTSWQWRGLSRKIGGQQRLDRWQRWKAGMMANAVRAIALHVSARSSNGFATNKRTRQY